MKEKDNIRHGDVDDMIFGSEAHVSGTIICQKAPLSRSLFSLL